MNTISTTESGCQSNGENSREITKLKELDTGEANASSSATRAVAGARRIYVQTVIDTMSQKECPEFQHSRSAGHLKTKVHHQPQEKSPLIS